VAGFRWAWFEIGRNDRTGVAVTFAADAASRPIDRAALRSYRRTRLPTGNFKINAEQTMRTPKLASFALAAVVACASHVALAQQGQGGGGQGGGGQGGGGQLKANTQGILIGNQAGQGGGGQGGGGQSRLREQHALKMDRQSQGAGGQGGGGQGGGGQGGGGQLQMKEQRAIKMDRQAPGGNLGSGLQGPPQGALSHKGGDAMKGLSR
jgi:hypothetical protein